MSYVLSFSACKPEDEANPESADPSAEFSFVVDQLKSTFTATDISASSYIWTFGDGDTSYQQDSIHYFDIGGRLSKPTDIVLCFKGLDRK